MHNQTNEKNNNKKSVYYDGSCSICVAFVEKISGSSQGSKFSLQDIIKCSLPKNLTKAEAEKEIHVIDANGEMYKNAEAILMILEEHPRWKLLVRIGRLPIIKQLLPFGYKLVSANRHFLFGLKNKILISRLKSFVLTYGGLDLRALALLRIGLAFTVLVNLFLRSQDLIAHYSEHGVLPIGPGLPYAETFIPHFFYASVTSISLLFLLTTTATLFLLLGYKTKIAAPITWFLIASLIARNPLINNSGDTALQLFLFWGIFLPWGKRYAFDALRRPERVGRPQSVFSLATMSYTLQVVVIYLFSGLYKISSHDWASGEGVYYMLNSTLSSGSGASFLLQFPGILSFFSRTLVPLLIVTPLLLLVTVFPAVLRVIAISAMMFFHVGLWLGMHLAIFPLAMIVALAGFLPSSFMNYVEKHTKKFWTKLKISSMFSRYQFFFRRLEQAAPSTLHHIFAPYIFIFAQCVVGIALIFVLANNIERYLETTAPIPSWIRRMGNELMLSQHWMMFHSAPHGKRWAVAVGYTKQGKKIRITLDGRRTYRDFLFHEDEYKNDRWREYDQRWYDGGYTRELNITGSLFSFICRTWNQRHRLNESLEYVEIFFGHNITPSPLLPSPIATEGEMKSVAIQQC